MASKSGSFIFRGYHPYFWCLKPFIFCGFGGPKVGDDFKFANWKYALGIILVIFLDDEQGVSNHRNEPHRCIVFSFHEAILSFGEAGSLRMGTWQFCEIVTFFGMVKIWPFQWKTDLQLNKSKGHSLNHLGFFQFLDLLKVVGKIPNFDLRFA